MGNNSTPLLQLHQHDRTTIAWCNCKCTTEPRHRHTWWYWGTPCLTDDGWCNLCTCAVATVATAVLPVCLRPPGYLTPVAAAVTVFRCSEAPRCPLFWRIRIRGVLIFLPLRNGMRFCGRAKGREGKGLRSLHGCPGRAGGCVGSAWTALSVSVPVQRSSGAACYLTQRQRSLRSTGPVGGWIVSQ